MTLWFGINISSLSGLTLVTGPDLTRSDDPVRLCVFWSYITTIK